MARRVVSPYMLVLIAVTGSGICQTPPAKSANSAGQQTASTAGGSGGVSTLKASAQLVLEDVVVTDSSHKAVHGLKASDFSLMEDGVPQALRHFEEHSALTVADATKFPPMPKLPAGVFTNYTPAPANGAVNLILLDTLNTPIRDQVFVRQQLLAYLKSMPPGARIAIFGLSSRLIMLQGFTSDPALLRMVLEKGATRGSPALNDATGVGGFPNAQSDALVDVADSGVDIPNMAMIEANVLDFEAVVQAFQLQLRAQFTLDAMNQIARYLANVPGRKNLIWFSGSFPINVMPDTSGGLSNPFQSMGSFEGEFRDTVNLLARSQVAVYPIDARGIMNPPMLNASTSQNYTGPRGAARSMQEDQKFFADTQEEQATMRMMADSTGGRAFVNTNGLTDAVSKAVEEGSNFYTLTYTPTNSLHDGKLRKIRVTLSRPGLTLDYRKGYYSDVPDTRPVPKLDAATKTAEVPTGRDTLHFAMTRGVPLPSEVIIKVGVVPLTPVGQTEDKVAQDNTVAEKTKGPYRRYSVNYAIDPAGLVYLQGPDGKIHVDFDLVIFVYTENGERVNALGKSVHIAMLMDDLRKLLDQGLFYHEEISAPAKGEYFLRIGVHELHDDHYGAVEVATSSVKNVRPAKANSNTAPAGATR